MLKVNEGGAPVGMLGAATPATPPPSPRAARVVVLFRLPGLMGAAPVWDPGPRWAHVRMRRCAMCLLQQCMPLTSSPPHVLFSLIPLCTF